MSHGSMRLCRWRVLALVVGSVVAARLWAGAPDATRPAQPAIPPEQRAARELLRRYQLDHHIQESHKRFLAEQHFKAGKGHFDLGAFQWAKGQFEKALQCDPQHKAAQDYLRKACGLLRMERQEPAALLGPYIASRKVALQMHRLELANLLADADTLYKRHCYGEALAAFGRAARKATWLAPWMDVGDAAEQAHLHIRKCREAIARQRQQETARQVQRARGLSQEQRRRRQARLGERRAALLARAQGLFEQRRYRDAAKLCDQILGEAPTHAAAHSLRAKALDASRRAATDQALEARDAEIGHHWRLIKLGCVPQAQLIYVPRDRFDEVRRRTATTAYGEARRDPPAWETRIRQALSKPVSFDFVETPLQDVITFLSTLTGVTMVVDAKFDSDPAPIVTLKVTDMRLESALRWVCKLVGLHYTLRDEAVFVTHQVQAEPELRVYDISDITMKVRDFKGRSRALATSEGQEGRDSASPALEEFFREPEEESEELTGEALVEFIQRVIAPGTWRGQGDDAIGAIDEW